MANPQTVKCIALKMTALFVGEKTHSEYTSILIRKNAMQKVHPVHGILLVD